LQGFVEANHYVSIEAEHFTGETSTGSVHWDKIPGFGETLSGMTVFPVTAPSVEPPQPAPVLEYKMYLFEGGTFNVEAILAPTLNFVPGRGLRYAISFDDQQPQIVDALEHNSGGQRRSPEDCIHAQSGRTRLSYAKIPHGRSGRGTGETGNQSRFSAA
jgi:hypothetical protein